jgi:protein transport protein SEC20
VLTGLLGASKQLVTALEKADWLDRILIFAALAFFLLVVLFILKQRVVDRGLRIAFWWTRFLPSMDRSDSQLLVKEDMIEKGITTTQIVAAVASSIVTSTANGLASQVASAAGPDWNALSTSTPGVHMGDTLSHTSPDPDVVDPSLFETATTSRALETPFPGSIHDEL